EYTKLIEALCEYENITNPILIGHSFGGRVAILFSSRNKTSKMVLVDAAGVKPRRSLKYYWKVYSFKTMKWIMRLLLGKEKSRKRIEAARSKRGSADYQNSTPMMRSVLSKVVNEDLRHVMPMIEAPTLLIWGGKDTATPLRDAEKMSKLIKDSGLVNFPNAGHYSFLDEPARFSTVLRSFLS
ncbi:MAG: alpha/beta hydrolase, partial [Muribaculaceae bacterium]|nr:alpha/beta hydrolase [Muribaculaceae bacterium]